MSIFAALRNTLCPALPLRSTLRYALGSKFPRAPTMGVTSNQLIARTKTHHAREKCYGGNEPKCSEKRLKEKGDCKKNKPKSMWENPECCLDPCKGYLPRFDDLYYRPSDKEKRKYTQTWYECPRIKIAPKKICCFEKIRYPPIPRRKKAECPKTACPVPTVDEANSCKVSKNKRCIKIRLPGCCPVRDPPRCFEIKGPSKCRKVCTPYPAYSECSRKKPRPLRPTECKCLLVGPICFSH